MLVTQKIEPVFNKEDIKAGMLIYAKNSAWKNGIGGFVTTVTDKEIVVQYHPGIGNVTNHFIINAGDVLLGLWEIRYSTDLLSIEEYPQKSDDNMSEMENVT